MAKLRVDKIASVEASTENTGSVFFDGNGDYLEIANNTDFQFGTGDWTIEFWWNGSASGTYTAIITTLVSSNEAGTWRVGTRFNSTNKIYFSRGTGSSFTDVQFDVDVNDEEWHHIAFVRSSGTIIPFVDGVDRTADLSSGSVSDSNSMTTTNPVKIGFNSRDDAYILGYISNLRVCKGHAVYKSNFTVPTRELDVHPGPDDDRTVLLACYDGENIFADKSGRHIIAAYGDRTSSPTPTATDSPIGITTFQPGLVRNVDNTFGPIFQGGAAYASQNWLTLPKGTTTQRNRGRGVFGGGNPGSASNAMQYVQIQSQGNALDFGDLTVARQASGLGSVTRGVFGGNAHPNGDTMDFITIASTGNAVDFGNLQSSLNGRASAANLTRGIFAGGGTPTVSNEIDFITIATLGNASDFGNLSVARRNLAGVASPTRAVFAGGDAGSTNDTIDFVTIATTGNATDFGNLSAARETAGGASSSTRGVFMGGYTSGDVDVIEYITIATTGNATDFGNLSAARRNGGSVSNNIRGLYAGGHPSVNIIEFVTIATTGDANDFGDLLVGQRINPNHVSDSHGGLS